MIKYVYDSFMLLDNINKVLTIIALFLCTFAVVVTIMDYTNKGKHINKKGW